MKLYFILMEQQCQAGRQGAGIGGVCYKNNVKLFSFLNFIGNKTNNEAEYFALIQ